MSLCAAQRLRFPLLHAATHNLAYLLTVCGFCRCIPKPIRKCGCHQLSGRFAVIAFCHCHGYFPTTCQRVSVTTGKVEEGQEAPKRQSAKGLAASTINRSWMMLTDTLQLDLFFASLLVSPRSAHFCTLNMYRPCRSRHRTHVKGGYSHGCTVYRVIDVRKQRCPTQHLPDCL